MVESYHEETKKRIGTDLSSFADPGSVRLGDGTRSFVAEWRMRSEVREARFVVSPDHGINVFRGKEQQAYRVFLASTEMGDLRRIAQMIGQTVTREIFVPTRAQRADVEDAVPTSATTLLGGLLDDEEADSTQIIMITGEAGAGKTKVLRELVTRQAERYLRGETERLLLYVNAQGRALARLNEALATELQDLRVNLTYHSVATLARVSLLVPVIDGFDELLGISGYDDAFNSLGAFLNQLTGQGRLVTSARSVYYEEEFLSRAGDVSTGGGQAWSHIPVKLLPWQTGDQTNYLDELAEREALPAEEKERLTKRVREVFKGSGELGAKPLFFARTVDLLLEDSEFAGGDDLLDTLSGRLLEREQKEKLLDRQHRPLLGENHLELLLQELAEEMWNQETHELDYASVREIAEFVLEDRDVSESSRQIAVERMPTLAFLAPSEKHESVQFEHEVFFFHFLARALANQFAEDKEMRVILSRSPLPEFVTERLAFELRKGGQLSSLLDMQKIFDRLSQASKTRWRRTTQVRENAGLIVLALLREFSANNGGADQVIRDRTVDTVIFPGSHLRNVTLRNCTFVNMEIRRTDLVTTTFDGCVAHDVLLFEPQIKAGSTRLELKGLRVPEDVYGLRQVGDEGNRVVYAPQEAAALLRECGVDVGVAEEARIRNVSSELVSLVERLMHAYERANIVCDGDDRLGGIFGHPKWVTLRERLVEFGIVKVEARAARGPVKNLFRRLFAPDEIMKGLSRDYRAKPQIVRFWDAVEALGE